MDTAIQMFKFENKQEIRVIQGEDGEPWFVAADVARALGYENPQKAIRDHCKGVSETFIPSAGGPQTGKIIAERDVYRLIMRSKLPEAERFEEWVVGDVLPSIRKHGGYVSPSRTGISLAHQALAMAQALVENEERLSALEQAEKARQQREQAAQATLLELPPPTTTAPEKSLRAALNENVRAYAQKTSIAFPDVWSKLYRELKYRTSFDAPTRAKHTRKSPLDLVEEAGLLPELYAIAREVLS